MDISINNIVGNGNIDSYDTLQSFITWGNRAVKAAVATAVVYQGIKNESILDAIWYSSCAYVILNMNDKYVVKYISDAVAQKKKLAKLQYCNSKSWNELQDMVGLDDVKKGIKQIRNNALINIILESKGEKPVYPSIHMQILGEPGTGKTEAAKLIAATLYEFGITKSNKVVFADRSSLASRYVNDSALKTEKKVLEAKNGCIIIDEAYALDSGDDKKDGGHEVIEKLLVMMEEHKDIVFIFLGYEDKMNALMDTNRGLKSRIGHTFKVNNYTVDELIDIFKCHCSKMKYTISAEALECVKNKLIKLKDDEKHNFGNARSVVNLLHKIIFTQNSRLIDSFPATGNIDIDLDKIYEITELDVEQTSIDTSQNEDKNEAYKTMYS